MLVMKDCAIEPGDILFVVSNSRKPLVRLKQAAQSLTTERSKHGHREVISVFVCTGKNKYGVICHNFEQRLSLSSASFAKTLQKQTIEELSVLLLNYCSKEFTALQIKEALRRGAPWMQQLANQMSDEEGADELARQLLDASGENKDKLMSLLLRFWRASGQAAVLPVVNSSLLVFKHTNRDIRQQFLEAYLAQVAVTQKFQAQKKSRTSLWLLFKSFFQRSSQDQKDKEQITPSDETYCARNVMQILNQVDPNLVNRGRHILPKSLEAGLREATKSKGQTAVAEAEDSCDDFEAMIAAQELPPFTLSILPASGKELMRVLLAEVDKEINRIETKRWANALDRQKAADLKNLCLPFRHPKFQNYSLNLQVETALKLIATLMPTLQRKTGFLGSWFAATSYSNIRAFARTQGIFDGDIREATEKLKDKPAEKVETRAEEQAETDHTLEHSLQKQIYIFSDWSFSSWSKNKREFMINHMKGLIASGYPLYTWENGRLVKMDETSLQTAIYGEDFDNLLSAKLTLATRATVLEQAGKQNLDSAMVQFLDYKTCQQLAASDESLETILNQVAPLYAAKQDALHLHQIKQSIIDIEIANAVDDTELHELHELKERLATQNKGQQKTYRGGIDTKAFVSQPQFRKPIFKPVDLMTLTPSSKYYRNEVYSRLVINKNPSSAFEYFELQGMNATEHLVDCKYSFHTHELTKGLIQKRKAATTQILFQGEKEFNLTGDWQALPSLHPNEILTDIAIKGLKRNDVEIKYSPENHLYFIRLTKPEAEPRTVSIDLLLKMPPEYRANPLLNTIGMNSKHQEIHRLLMSYLKFGKDEGQLRDTIGKTVHNGEEYLDAVRKLGVASCRLRVIAFKEEMMRLYPEIPVLIDVNSDHWFIEMELDGVWKRYCLGGYRDTPGMIESVKKDISESCRSKPEHHRFFTTKSRAQSDVAVREIPEEELRGPFPPF